MFLIPTVKKQVFHEDLLYLIRKEIEYLKTRQDPEVHEDNEDFYRLYRHNDPFFKEVHHMIAERFSQWVGEKVKPSYCFASMYKPGEGKVKKHTDRPQCKYTLDICINQNYPWAINVAGANYMLEAGDALVFSGTDHVHYRPDRLNADNYCDLIFFHFVPVNFEGRLD
jgi:hypothetical protein